ncbi:hypothetical protein MAMC_00961 [Methylacidimicrobium cyclopophantes]|uniref:Uncharacterized protein n=1 Tax=Methylacidimicrobium cyclopophantes TaxID=1041766 RepID=A0A5E6MAA8_9BACT|nr:hypothetical protein MAMC_00961 [Methylacidimicrobium cyclopophantes]
MERAWIAIFLDQGGAALLQTVPVGVHRTLRHMKPDLPANLDPLWPSQPRLEQAGEETSILVVLDRTFGTIGRNDQAHSSPTFCFREAALLVVGQDARVSEKDPDLQQVQRLARPGWNSL